MKRHKDKWAMADDLRAQREEDGFSGRVSRRRRQENKLGGLCRQVQRTIGLSLSGECHDPVLRDLQVWAVMPAPDASRLLVQVYFGAPRPEVSLVELLGRLDRVNAWLRGEVAHSIVRKRAPELLFQLIDPREAREAREARGAREEEVNDGQ